MANTNTTTTTTPIPDVTVHTEHLAEMQGRRRVRTITADDIEQCATELRLALCMGKLKDVVEIRWYLGGWVPNSYRYRAEATGVTATYDADTETWNVHPYLYDAKRAHGSSAGITYRKSTWSAYAYRALNVDLEPFT